MKVGGANGVEKSAGDGEGHWCRRIRHTAKQTCPFCPFAPPSQLPVAPTAGPPDGKPELAVGDEDGRGAVRVPAVVGAGEYSDNLGLF
eukprot:NODE_7583_length_394_cov_83.936232_g5902_i0.p3 GENE.NODE_7583_length_394_cov_83.936232_g5902_i0~~NODE_7583_length_394_cov_83.936232_g5902_i0.p3  ORF type:complete len:99 (+),score=31.98 NODE_7583_length_394_cov_83.936232_g5902_i0:35-298(+)